MDSVYALPWATSSTSSDDENSLSEWSTPNHNRIAISKPLPLPWQPQNSQGLVCTQIKVAHVVDPPSREEPEYNYQLPAQEINILLLGESGVGKSTFINSFANYMKHENFEAVNQENLVVLIPARFNIFDREFKKHLIEIGESDDNEFRGDGAAATQDVKTYVFSITLDDKRYKIRFVDTPGMCDPRGIDQDNKNCDHVLNYLGTLDKVHAVCLLFNPTNTRLNVFLNYCVTQILSRLEKSATNNIAFIFTNTRGHNYTPGETYTSLEVLIKTIKDSNNVSIPLSFNNVFCFDNEAFRYITAVMRGVQFREGVRAANIDSWKYSYNECWRLLSYIVGLNPHDAKKTLGINKARKMVLQLSQPMADIVQLIGDNIYNLTQHTKQLLSDNQTLNELRQQLYMPVIDIQAKELDKPVTVCTDLKCATVYQVGDKNKFHYKQRCHDPCYLNDVPAEIIGDPKLRNCTAMGHTEYCKECKCRYNVHMHIYYETETFERKIKDQNVEETIKTKQGIAAEKQRIINNMCTLKEELEKEHSYIIECSAAFAHFLQNNAITAMNDSLKEYVNHLIKREENQGHLGSQSTLEYLRRVLAEYEEQKKILNEALKLRAGASMKNVLITPEKIEERIQKLFVLKHFGKKIKGLYRFHQAGGVREYKKSETVIKHEYKKKGFFGRQYQGFKEMVGLGHTPASRNSASMVVSRK